MPKLADIHTCTGCLACVDICPKTALSYCKNEEGHIAYELEKDNCVECGLCERICPVVSGFKYGENKLADSTPYAAWAKDAELRLKSTSGGVFAALSKFIISQGGIVVGASLKKNDIRHILVNKEEDILRLQGSKYAQSNTEGIFKDVKSNLIDGRKVLFSGLGCQVAGLLSYLGNMKYSGQLITVDLICGGVPSRFLIDYYLKHNPDVDEIVAFRNKSRYEFSVKDKDGNIKIIPLSARPLPLCGFYTELTNRYSCYDCKFNGTHRKSDITIGDYWGDKQYLEEHRNGLSIAVSHSDKGKVLLQESELEIHEVGWGTFLINNPRMIDGHKNASKSKARINMAKSFRELPYEKILQVYANKATWHEPLLMIRKLFRHAAGYVYKILYRNKLKRTISKLVGQ
jgi:coenzyme F420-reducing hydrogenase beta subunit